MCGIAGIIECDRRPVDAEPLRRMIAQLKHRGPDANGCYVDNNVGLAHARLSIIDLETGQQPMVSADGQTAITFNGEIYNYIELTSELKQRGCVFRTSSDTEVILHAYQVFGEACVDHLNGQWAFAIWDRRRRRMMLSRDRLGIRPLFYTRQGKTLLFASEIKALLTHPIVPRQLDPIALSQVFHYWCSLAPRTMFQSIAELPPGHNLIVEGDQAEVKAYWQLDYSPLTSTRSVSDWADRLRALLVDAVRLRLRADVPVGAYLSGGLDSSLIASLVRQVSSDQLRTFSVTFDDAEFDESEYQRTMVQALGVRHHALHCSQQDIARVFPNVVWHAETPVLRTAPAPLHMLSELVHDADFKVVLTGEGADEMFGGYDLFKEAKVRRFCARNRGSEMRQSLFGKLYPYLPGIQAQSQAMRRAFFQAGSDVDDQRFFSHLPRWNTTSPLQRLIEPDFLGNELGQIDGHEEVRATLPEAFGSWPSFCQAQFLESTILMPGYLLSSQGDRAAMAHSVEGRFPFLDHRLAEMAGTLPVRWKMFGIKEKYLLKRAFKDLLPDPVVKRTKQPYRAPDALSFIDTRTGEFREEYAEELLSARCLADYGVFRPDAVTRLVRKFQSGRRAGVRDNMALVGVLSTQLLINQFVRSVPRSPLTNVSRPALDYCTVSSRGVGDSAPTL